MRDTIDIKSESDLTKDILFDLFDCVDGVLYWKKSPSNSVKAGAKAGNKTNQATSKSRSTGNITRSIG